MALPFFNKHLAETTEGLLLDALSPQAYGNSCWSRADVSREALLARLASACNKVCTLSRVHLQSLPVARNTSKHVR